MASSKAATVAAYLEELLPERRAEIAIVRDLVNEALPEGYVEVMSYGMIGWVIPLQDYPVTYNGQPLAYALRGAWAASGKKLDMGKSCIRFKRASDLALDVVRDEIAATAPAEFIALYERVKPPAR